MGLISQSGLTKGMTHVKVTVRNPAEPEHFWDGLFLVDKGGADCLIPGKRLREIGLKKKAKRTYKFADGSSIVRLIICIFY